MGYVFKMREGIDLIKAKHDRTLKKGFSLPCSKFNYERIAEISQHTGLSMETIVRDMVMDFYTSWCILGGSSSAVRIQHQLLREYYRKQDEEITKFKQSGAGIS